MEEEKKESQAAVDETNTGIQLKEKFKTQEIANVDFSEINFNKKSEDAKPAKNETWKIGAHSPTMGDIPVAQEKKNEKDGAM